MKSVIKTFFAAALLLALNSCGWLDVTPSNSIDSKDLFETGYGFRNALNGIYLAIGSENLYGKNLSWGFLSAVSQEYLNDESEQGQRTDAALSDAADLVYNSSNTEPVVTEIWENAYSVIANINKLLSEIDAVDSHEFAYGEDEKALIKAEASALRAMLHFDLLRLFAPAPVTSPSGTYIPYRDTYSATASAGLSVHDFGEKILADISAAEDALRSFDTQFHPTAMYASLMSGNSAHWNARYRFDSRSYIDEMGEFFWFRGWRMNYMALLALKARVCYYLGADYRLLARSAARELYDSFYTERQWVGFTPSENISCNIDSRYKKLSDDVLFAAYNRNLADTFDDELSGANNTIRMPLAGVDELFASDRAGIYGDWRYTYLIGTSNSSARVYYTRKYSSSPDAVVSVIENPMVPLIRFSEVCYILASLAADDGDVSRGIEYLETVRRARGAERDLSLTVTTPEQLRDEILLDERKEFIAEGGAFYCFKARNLSSVPGSRGGMRNMEGGYVLPVPESENPF